MKMYTAQEMRVRAAYLESALADAKTAAMLRQAADMMDSAERVIADRDNWRRQALDEDARANAATIKESLTVGNAAAMRDACANIAEYAKTAACHTEDAHLLGYLNQIEKWAEAALSFPTRNCDVVTSE